MAVRDRWYMRRAVEQEQHNSEDSRIRAVGFVIVARPADGAPMWKRDGVTMSHARALVVAERELAARSKPVEVQNV